MVALRRAPVIPPRSVVRVRPHAKTGYEARVWRSEYPPHFYIGEAAEGVTVSGFGCGAESPAGGFAGSGEGASILVRALRALAPSFDACALFFDDSPLLAVAPFPSEP